jgi:hypothetical protein
MNDVFPFRFRASVLQRFRDISKLPLKIAKTRRDENAKV